MVVSCKKQDKALPTNGMTRTQFGKTKLSEHYDRCTSAVSAVVEGLHAKLRQLSTSIYKAYMCDFELKTVK